MQFRFSRFTVSLTRPTLCASLAFAGSPGDRPFLVAVALRSKEGRRFSPTIAVTRGGVSAEHGATPYSIRILAPMGDLKPVRVGDDSDLCRIRADRFRYSADLAFNRLA